MKKKDALSLDTCFRITLQGKSTNDVELTERLQEKEQALVVQYFFNSVYLATYTDCLESGYLKNYQNKNKNNDIKQIAFVQRSTINHVSYQ